MPTDADTNLFVSPAKARELQAMLDWFRRYPFKAGPPDGYRGSRPSGSTIPHPKIGKAHDNIPPRTFGAVDIWSGKPGSETKLDFLTSPVQEFNLLDRTITAGKFVWMFGQYIFGADFPARFVDCTLSGALSGSGSVSATVNGHFDGDAPINSDGTTASTIDVAMPPLDGLPAIASGKKIRAVWNDVEQRYEALQWGCA